MELKRHVPAAMLLGVGLALVLAACQPAPVATPEKQAGKEVAAAAPAATSKLLLSADTVQGSKNLTEEEKVRQSCVPNSRFPRNAQVVFRARILDPRTGEGLDDQAVSLAEVQLSNGTNLKMKYGPHGDNKEMFWTTNWLVPKDYATGSLTFTIVANSMDGRTGTFKPFDVASSQLTVTDPVLPDIIPPPKPKA